jgi:hypothetical protein
MLLDRCDIDDFKPDALDQEWLSSPPSGREEL